MVRKTRSKEVTHVGIRRRLLNVDNKISYLGEFKTIYAKNMIKFGFAAWDFGLSFFFLSSITLSLSLHGNESTWVPLLMTSLVVSIMMATCLSLRFIVRIKRLENLRRSMFKEYQRSILNYVWNTLDIPLGRFKAPNNEEEL